ncbi:hypothetical protein ABGB14_48290 [Nonomuraea sp. B10E15]|uniref:hypothetical protein n=1 Tax=Nonomuraea sp. B10E15 TaxID=3153560 RepID=UPI00325CFD01
MLMLDGWRDNGTSYTVRVTKEQIGDAKCTNLRTFATSGRQHYVKWGIPSTGYCVSFSAVNVNARGSTPDHAEGVGNDGPGDPCLTDWLSTGLWTGRRTVDGALVSPFGRGDIRLLRARPGA